MNRPDWKVAYRKALAAPILNSAKWHASPAYQLFLAHANGKAAADWSQTRFVGMARGYADMAAHNAFTACPDLREVSACDHLADMRMNQRGFRVCVSCGQDVKVVRGKLVVA